MTCTRSTALTGWRRAQLGAAGFVTVGALVIVGIPVIGVSAAVAQTTTTTVATAATKRVINVSARSYKFTPSKLRVTKGESVTIALKSTDALHDFVVTGPGNSNRVVVSPTGPGQTKRGTLRIAKPGTYQFYCSLPGHRAAGMRGTITVS